MQVGDDVAQTMLNVVVDGLKGQVHLIVAFSTKAGGVVVLLGFGFLCGTFGQYLFLSMFGQFGKIEKELGFTFLSFSFAHGWGVGGRKDWMVMAMGGWGGTVEEVGLFVAHKGVRLVVFLVEF